MMMADYVPTICFVCGLLTGIGVTIGGFLLGFKASYEIRNHKEESTEDKGLFRSKKDPVEFDLIKDEQ